MSVTPKPEGAEAAPSPTDVPPAHAHAHEAVFLDGDIDPRAPFTRRTFLKVTGAAAVAASVPIATSRPARAAGDPVHAGSVFRIHPAIGFARLGNAPPDTFFVGPEAPGFGPVYDGVGTPVPNYKAGGLIKPQACRFRVWEYVRVNGKLTPRREVTLGTDGVADIRWSVHLANKKAAFYENDGGAGEVREPGPLRNLHITDPAQRKAQLEIDFGPRQILGSAASPVPFTPATAGAYPATVPKKADGTTPVIGYLGQLRADPAGRLLVLGGTGATGYDTATQPEMPHWSNNDHWFDDASDGPVSATVILDDGTEVPMDPVGDAWVLCGPPDMAPGVPGSVTGYDLLLDLAVRELDLPTDDAAYLPGGPLHELAVLKSQFTPNVATELPGFSPHFGRHIQPMLVAAYNLWWVNGLVNAKHNSLINPNLGNPASAYASARKKVFGYMRAPVGVPAGTGQRTMPKLMGDDPYLGSLPDAVRNLALTHVQFAMLKNWADGQFTPGTFEPTFAITPHGLDQAALENTVGGAFFPGIEFGFQMRNPALFAEPFRLDPHAFSGWWGEGDVPIGPGYFTRQMAVPWQADFNDCRNEGNYGWWPSQRPTHALPNAAATTRLDWARPNNRFEGRNRESNHEDMVNHWYKFGFVLEEGDLFVEKERAATIP